MPHQNLQPEVILAIAIWLIPIFIFVIMLSATLVSLIAENKIEAKSTPKTAPQFAGVLAKVKNTFRNVRSKIDAIRISLKSYCG